MKNSIYFVFAIFFVLLICCNKGDPINNSESQSNEQLVKKFMEKVKNSKNGLTQRDGEDYTDSEAESLVEITLNYTYALASELYLETDVQTQEFTVAKTNNLISQSTLNTFYNNALSFCSDHFYGLENENKIPKGYDLEIISTSSSSVTFKVYSIVDYGTIVSPFATKIFEGITNYPAMIGFANNCTNLAPKPAFIYIKQFANYNLKPTPFGYYSQINTIHLISDDINMWYFACNNSPGICLRNAPECNSFSSGEIDQIYCLNAGEMNEQLDEFQGSVVPGYIPSSYQFLNVNIVGETFCYHTPSGSFDDEWFLDLSYGTYNTLTSNARLQTLP